MGGITIALSIMAVLVIVGLVLFAYLAGGISVLGIGARRRESEALGAERPRHRVPNKERQRREGTPIPRQHEHDPA